MLARDEKERVMVVEASPTFASLRLSGDLTDTQAEVLPGLGRLLPC